MDDTGMNLLFSRRRVVTGIGAIGAAALPGCSGSGDGDSETETTESETAGSQDESTSDTPNDSDTTTSDGQQTDDHGSGVSSLVEEDEPQIESEYETRIDELIPNQGWIELENPEEQIPRENYNFEDFPNLQLLEDEENDFNAYDSKNEAVYLIWLEYEDGIGLTAFQVTEYGPEDGVKQSLGSDKYTDQSADIEGILGEVVEGVDDVPEDLDAEYVELLT